MKTELVIASSNNFPPINMLDENGQLTGFGRDMADAVAAELGLEVRHIHSAIWPNVLQWLDEGSADLIHDAGYTPEREASMDFTTPIVEMPESIFVREQQYDIHDISSLAGKKVACVNRHITHLYLQGFQEIQCHLVNTPAEGLVALINGNADAFIYPEQIVRYMAQQLGLEHKIKVVGDPLRTLTWSMTVKKGNTELLDALNRGISRVKTSGQYQQIYKRWFGRHLLSGYTENEVLAITSATVLIAILLVVSAGLAIHTRGMRRAQAALAASEKIYRTLSDELPADVFLKDTNSVYISCNERYANSLGIDPTGIVGRTDYDFHPENAAIYQAGDRKIIESGKTQEFIERFVDEKGRSIYIHTIKSPVFDDNGKLTGVLGIFWDITQEKELQDRLSSIVNEYDAITATVPDVMYKLDTEGRFTWVNERFAKVTGYACEDMIGMPVLEMVASEDRDKAAQAIRQVFEQGMSELEARLKTTRGETEYYFNGARLLDEEGKLVGLVGSGRDMTRQNESEQEHQRLQTQLLQAQKMETIGQLTGGIAHDFNNMLASILGYGELSLQGMDTGATNEKLRTYLSEIVRSGERARDLVAQMLTFARTNKGEAKPVMVAELIDEIVTMLRPMIPSSIELKRHVEDDLPSLLVDPVMVQQMLINLCINARDALNGHGSISLHAGRCRAVDQVCDSCHEHFHGDFVQVDVTDTGAGIDTQILSRIFEPFMTTKEIGKGTGMGLAMVHGITHDHQGHIQVQSEPGHTRFSILLPADAAVDPSSVEDAANHAAKPAYDSGHHHILVVDDEITLSELFREMLTAQGYRVTVEHDSRRALKLFEEHGRDYDLVITDQTMPGLTGSQIAEKMLALRPELPIALCTGYSDDIDEQRAKQIGIKAFVNKPVNNQALLVLIQQLLPA